MKQAATKERQAQIDDLRGKISQAFFEWEHAEYFARAKKERERRELIQRIESEQIKTLFEKKGKPLSSQTRRKLATLTKERARAKREYGRETTKKFSAERLSHI